MNLFLRNTVARFLIAGYVLAGVLIEVGHHDVHDIVLDRTPTVAAHECGANEIHVPLDKRHECLACSQSTLRLATAATSLPANITAFLCLGYIFVTNEHTFHTDVIHSGKRGPPLA